MSGSSDANKRPFTGGLVVMSGPSGSGKTTLVNRVCADDRVDLAVTATTRPPRPGERDGVHYYFLSRSEFEDRIARGDFVEYQEVFRNGHLYGSLKQPLEEALDRTDRYYLLEIDVEGGAELKRLGFEGQYIFIEPPSLEVLKERIESRGTESAESIETRLKKARVELERGKEYDVVIVNDDLERAYREVCETLGLDTSATTA